MNEEELKANKEVTEYVVHDLNLEPALPFPDNTFDVITNAVSVDYLNKPREVFQEIHRWVGFNQGQQRCWGFAVAGQEVEFLLG